MELRIAIQTLLLPGNTMHEKFENAARYEFDAVEVAVGPQFDLGEHLEDVSAASRSTKVPVAAICTHPIHDPLQADVDERTRRLRVLGELVRMADDLGAAGVVSVPVRPSRGFSSSEERVDYLQGMADMATTLLQEWADGLPQGPAALFLEPLNRYEASFLNTVGQAVEIASQINHPRVKVLADLFHMNIEEANLVDPVLIARQSLGHVHIADNNRLQPGAGYLDFVPTFTALHSIDYGGYVSLECFSPEGPLIAGDPDLALPETVRFLREQWQRAQSSQASRMA